MSELNPEGCCCSCKWWDRQWHDCESPKVNDPADAETNAGIQAPGKQFVVGPQFGCIHWERKE